MTTHPLDYGIVQAVTPAILRAKAAEADTGRVQYASSFLALAADRIEALEEACRDALATLQALLHQEEFEITPSEVAWLYNATTDSLTKLLKGF